VTWELAWRNTFRNPRRSAIGVLAVMAGMMALVVVGGVIEFTVRGLRERTIRTQTGHLQLTRVGHPAPGAAVPADDLIDDFPALAARLRVLPHVRVVAARLSFAGLVSAGGMTRACRGIGVVAASEEQLTSFETLVAGRPLGPALSDGAIVGRELFAALGGRLGQPLTLLTTTVDGTLNTLDVRVAGAGQTGSPEDDAVSVEVPLAVAQRLLNTARVETVVVLLDATEHTEEVAALVGDAIKTHPHALELRTWDELAGRYHRVVAMYRGIFRVMQVLIAAVVLVSIATAMTVAVFRPGP
jgi:putative ABC transport system permease protein